MIKELSTGCDMGPIKIFTKDVALFYSNGVGDTPTNVDIDPLPNDNAHNSYGDNYKSLEHFTVKTNYTVFLSSCDCEDDPLSTFGIGRWFVYLKKPGHFVIHRYEKEDLDC